MRSAMDSAEAMAMYAEVGANGCISKTCTQVGLGSRGFTACGEYYRFLEDPNTTTTPKDFPCTQEQLKP